MMNATTKILERARSNGWSLLPEPEGYALLTALGLPLPAFLEFAHPRDLTAEELARLTGERVVLKVVCPDLPHKSEVGGICIQPREIEAIRAAARKMLAGLSEHAVMGFVVQEWIDYDPEIGGELLVNLRWDREFGPVLTCGPGGIHAEILGRDLKRDRGLAIASCKLGTASLAETLAASTAVDLMTTPHRGRPPRLPLGVLVDTLSTLATRAELLLEAGIEEIEINPLVIHGTRLVPLDVLVRVSSQPHAPDLDRPTHKLRNLLEPASIAIIGVSRQLNPGHRILRNILREGFDPRRVYVLKPGETQIDGCRCYPDVGALPETVDLLIVAIAAEQVPSLMDEILAARVAEGVIIIPGGLDEKPGGSARLSGLLESLRQTRLSRWQGPVVNGGNSMGIRSAPGRYDTFFLPDYKVPPMGRPESVAALIAQSGAFLAARSSKLSAIPFKYSISIGNQLDLTLGDYLQYLTEDPNLQVIGVYAEGFKTLDGLRFLEAVAEHRARGRTVVLYRAGRSAQGALAAASHTASVAGSYATTVALARAAGALVAESMADFEDLVDLSFRLADRPLQGRRLAGLSNAGFECVTLSDHLGWFAATDLATDTVDSLQEILDRAGVAGLVDVRNPLDVTPMMGDELFSRAVEALLADPGVDAGMVGCVPLTGDLDTLPADPVHVEDLHAAHSIASRLADLWRRTSKPWVTVVDGGRQYDPFAASLQRAGIPTFRTIDRAMRMLETYGRESVRLGAKSRVDSAQG